MKKDKPQEKNLPPLNHIYQAHSLEFLSKLPDECIDTIIASPPYWGLRDYGDSVSAFWNSHQDIPWYGQLGLEPTLSLYLDHLLAITAELKRVLKPTGILFWNHGDSFGGSGCGRGDYHNNNKRSPRSPKLYVDKANPQRLLTPKCLSLQNFRLITKMVDEQGWILRNILHWTKQVWIHKEHRTIGSTMPTSVQDRFNVSEEPVFMLVKNRKYWFDLDAVRLPHQVVGVTEHRPMGIRRQRHYNGSKYNQIQFRPGNNGKTGLKDDPKESVQDDWRIPNGKCPPTVWQINPQPLLEAHFASFPEALIAPLIRAACPKWVCTKCGKARVGVTEGTSRQAFNIRVRDVKEGRIKASDRRASKKEIARYREGQTHVGDGKSNVGWTDCGCGGGWQAGIILDPFMGSGTVAVVARKLGRNFIGIELNPAYIKIAQKRLQGIKGERDVS